MYYKQLIKQLGKNYLAITTPPLSRRQYIKLTGFSGLSFGAAPVMGAEITLKDGVVQQSNFHDYILPRMPHMPEIDVDIVESTEPPTGVGEPGLPPVAPVIANAIFALTGKPIRSLPLRSS